MVELKIINSESLSLLEVKERLESLKESRKELSVRANKTLNYLHENIRLSKEKAEELKKEIEKLDMPRLKERHIIKIIDVLPTSVDNLKMLLSNENLPLKQEDYKKLSGTIEKFI